MTVTSCSTAFSRSSNSPRYFAPAISAPMSSASSFLSCKLSGTSPLTIRCARPFHDRGLADARFADQHRIVFGAAGEHLDGAPDLLVAADHRIDLAVAGGLSEITRVFFQRVIAAFSRAGIGGAALAQCIDRRVEILRGHTRGGQYASRLAVLLEREREQQPFDRDIAVARLFRDLLRLIENPRQSRSQIDLASAATGNFGKLGERRLDSRKRLARSAAGAIDQAAGQTLGVIEQNLEQVLGRELLVALAQGQRLSRLNKPAGAVGIFLEIHVSSLGLPVARAHRAGVSPPLT